MTRKLTGEEREARAAARAKAEEERVEAWVDRQMQMITPEQKRKAIEVLAVHLRAARLRRQRADQAPGDSAC